MIVRCLVVLGLCLGVMGCATVPPPASLDVRELKLAGVEVKVESPVASWPAGEAAFIASGTDPQAAETLKNSPAHQVAAAQPFLKASLQRVVEAAVNAQISPLMRGPTPARVRVTVTQFSVPSPLQRLLVDNTAKFQARFEIVGHSNAVLASYDAVGAQFVPGGLGTPLWVALESKDPGVEVVDGAVMRWRQWLTRT